MLSLQRAKSSAPHILSSAHRHQDSERGSVEDSRILLHLDHVVLQAEFTSVPDPRGVVIFATGSGSGRHSPRNRYVAECLRSQASLATLVVDLVVRGETSPGPTKFAPDVRLLADRLIAATDWVHDALDLPNVPLGYLGVSVGAAAALIASVARPEIGAIVSRGGRIDLAEDVLDKVTAPTLLIAGREDATVLDVNRTAQERLAAVSELLVVPGASYLFEEPRALDQVASSACSWFQRYLQLPERSEVLAAGTRMAQ